MAKSSKKKTTASIRQPSHRLLPLDALIDVSDLAVETEKLNEIANLVRLAEGMDKDTKNARIARAIELYESVNPQSGLEGMLAVQMVGTHVTALECLRRAMVEGQTFEGREMNLKHAQKLIDLYLRQLAALDRHRGKGQQKVTVEHVHVEAGGQAIVGHVDAGGRKTGTPATEPPPAVDHRPESPAEFHRASAPKAGAKARRNRSQQD
ncbi:MAG: hypothetical protein EA407_14925 [Rhodobacteraceae bacterium]|nr:MAG: hypothetical protein EA407_14925 [Paracoccaceae bacterium]